MTSTETDPETGMQKGVNWWGCFVIGLAGPILVTGIDPPAVQALGAAAVPLIAVATVMGVLLCLFAAELATVMPHRTGGIPSYTTEAFEPVHRQTSTHLGGLAAWAYWLGWFPVAPINMILASAYITQLFHVPAGHSFQPFGDVGSPVALGALIISVIAIIGMFVPAWLGIKFGAAAATVMGVLSMAPLTVLILLPLARPSSMHWSNLAGFHYASGVTGSPTLLLAWLFVITWSVLGVEAAACYLGESHNPSKDAKIAMTMEGVYGVFIYVMTAVMLVLVLGVAANTDPLTIFSTFITSIFGASGGWVQWAIGLPLIVALLLSCLNAIMGCARSLFQASEDKMLPRFFGHLNKHGVPDRSMAFNVVASILVLLFGSPLRIYIFSNIGYLFAVMMGFFSYFVHRQTRTSIERPFRLHGSMRWVALALGIFCAFLWAFGGWNSPSVVIGTPSHELFFIGVLIVAAYLPLYLWRRVSDKRRGGDETPPVEAPEEVAEPATQA
jgi:amino acid transporter